MGGLSRRATILEQQRQLGATLVVDAGDLFWKSATVPESRIAQQRVKAALQMDAYALGGIDAMVPGDADLALGVEWLAKETAERSLPYVASNMSCDGWSLPTHRIIERSGLRIAVLGVVGLKQAGPCSAVSTVPAIKKAVEESADADLHVLLSHQRPDHDESIVRSVPEIDVVVNGHGRKAMTEPNLLDERAVQLNPGTRGKKLGVAELSLVPDGGRFVVLGLVETLRERLQRTEKRYQRTIERMETAATTEIRDRTQTVLARIEGQVADLKKRLEAAQADEDGGANTVRNRLKGLTDDVPDHGPTRKLVERAKEQIEAAGRAVVPKAPSQRIFVGDRMCQGCHSEQHAQWSSTPHASAWSTLVKVGRSQDLDCYACHVTGAHHADGPQRPQEARGLENVGCESCHGPGADHIRAPSRSTINRTPTESVCTECHDGVKDEGRFDFTTYMPRVEH